MKPHRSWALGCVAIFLALLFQQTRILKADEPVAVNVSQLLAAPTEFDGKHVSVTGYYVNSFKSGSCLFTDRVSAKAHDNAKSIWVDETTFAFPPALIGISEVCELKDHYVRIVGIFRFRGHKLDRGFGLGELWPSEVTGIVNFRVAHKTAEDPKNPCAMYPRN